MDYKDYKMKLKEKDKNTFDLQITYKGNTLWKVEIDRYRGLFLYINERLKINNSDDLKHIYVDGGFFDQIELTNLDSPCDRMALVQNEKTYNVKVNWNLSSQTHLLKLGTQTTLVIELLSNIDKFYSSLVCNVYIIDENDNRLLECDCETLSRN